MTQKANRLCGRLTTGLMLSLLFVPIFVVWANNSDLFDHASDLVREEKYEEALSTYEDFIEANPEHSLVPAAKWTMANIHLMVFTDYENAAEAFERIIKDYPGTEWEIVSYDRLIVCYRNMEDHESLIRIYRESLAKNPAAPSAPESHYNLAQVYLGIDSLKQAADNFVLVVDRYPVSGYARRVQSEHSDLLVAQCAYDWTHFSTFQTAQEYSQTARYAPAVAAFNEVIEAKRNTGMDHAAQFQKQLIEFRKHGNAETFREDLIVSMELYSYGFGGVAVDQLDNILETIIDAKAAIESNPEDAGEYATMAFGYYQLQAYRPAIESYKRGIAVDPDNSGLYNMMGYCYVGMQQYDEAIAAFQQLIDVAPEDPNAYDSMGEAHYLKGDSTAAIQFYQQSLAVDSTFTNPYYMLGEIYHGLDDDEKARTYLERYLELAPDGFQAQGAQGLLTQINEEQ